MDETLFQVHSEIKSGQKIWYITEADSNYARSMWDRDNTYTKRGVWDLVKKMAQKGEIVYVNYADGSGSAFPFGHESFTFLGDRDGKREAICKGMTISIDDGYECYVGMAHTLQFDPNSGKFVLTISTGFGDEETVIGTREGENRVVFEGARNYYTA